MRRAVLVCLALVAAAACDGHARRAADRPVLLWSAPRAGLEFPLPPEAEWRPVYQKLRRELAAREGGNWRWACFSAGDFDRVLSFYRERYGLAAGSVRVTVENGQKVFATVRRVAAGLGHPVPAARGRSRRVRTARLGARGNLPAVMLESPFLDLDTGRVRPGTLISMSWRPAEDAP